MYEKPKKGLSPFKFTITFFLNRIRHSIELLETIIRTITWSSIDSMLSGRIHYTCP